MRQLCFVLALSAAVTACAARERHIIAHYESPPDDLLAVPPCDLATWKAGLTCRGTAHSTTPTVLTGDWAGRTEYQYGWLSVPSGVTYVANVETFTGTVKGCGAGSFTYFMTGPQDADGTIHVTWSIIDGAGTGALSRLQGDGTLTGVFRDDLSSAGDFRGAVRCGP
jgi:hypothetical protein